MLMKFWIGFILGGTLTGVAFNNMTAEQRRRAASVARTTASKVSSSRVGEAVSDGASDVAATVAERASDAVRSGADTVAEVVEKSPSETGD